MRNDSCLAKDTIQGRPKITSVYDDVERRFICQNVELFSGYSDTVLAYSVRKCK